MTENEKIIQEALSSWNILDAKTELIRHNENITCKVVHGDKKFVLRIHQPKEGFCTSLITGQMDDIQLFQSESQLLLHLSQNGFDGLQKPVPNKNGEYITIISSGVPAMLLDWVEGEPLTPEEAPKYVEKIGEMICRIHKAARNFTGKRFAYDNELCDRMISEINRALSLEHIEKSAAEKCIHELEIVKKVMKKLLAEESASVIHADLSFGNILLTNNGLIPIDFSLSGYSSFSQEVGMVMSNFQDEESCTKLMKSISACGMNVNRTDADIFLSLSVLLFICSQHDRFYTEPWFKGSMNKWCSEVFIH